MIKYIFFDVSGTLLYKPDLYSNIQNVLQNNNIGITLEVIAERHKLLSEVIHFPDVTSADFYQHFNAELLRSIGVVPNKKLIKEIFEACTYLPWQKFDDCVVLKELNVPIGIISNFNKSLRSKLEEYFDVAFSDIFISEELGVAKPNPEIFVQAMENMKEKFLPNEILYVGDSIKLDIEPALSVGMQTKLIDRNKLFPESSFAIHQLQSLKALL